jgi:hypothetical protein
MISNLKEGLKNFSSDDFLLAIGNPTAMVVSGIIAAQNNAGKINMLYWDSKIRDYIKVVFDM